MEQGNSIAYYSKLKKLWEELNVLQPMPQCTCGVMCASTCDVSNEIVEIMSQTKLIQFLVGLNECYDHVKNQILVLDLLPYVNKVYSMILRVEKQKNVQLNFT
uniref:Uncharacterized protein n=1 Tax=Manihot esculenta TaxID=3983 RepID=A0A2C9U7A2_MANES